MRIAMLLWGDVIEDFLDPIGLTLEDFRDHMTGGWAFGYIDALQRVGVETDLICFSARTPREYRWIHAPTGASLWVLRSPRLYGMLRGRLADPYAWTSEDAIGDVTGVSRAVGIFARHAAPYCATPLLRLARRLRKERYAALLCQEYEYPRFDVCAALGVLLQLPVFATFQGGDYQLTLLEPKVRPHSLRVCNGVIVGSSREAARLHNRYHIPREKVARIFNPFEVEAWAIDRDSQARRELGIPPDDRVVAWHGRVELHRKGLDVLCHAWQLLSCDDPHAHLVLLGTGVDADELHRRIEGMQLPRVHWVNEYVVDRSVIQRHLSAADVYVFPSRHEGFPVAPIEAMASGLPVVAADASGVSDIFENGETSGGLVVGREDGPALAEGLRRVLGNDAWRRELGRRARRRVETAFGPVSVGRQLHEFLVRRSTRTGTRPKPLV